MLNAIIDISHHNTISSFKTVKSANILGVMHKATQGTVYVDPTFSANKKAITSEGLLFGAYHFGVGGDPIAQAEHFVETAGRGALLVLDFEGNPQGQSMSLLEAEHFVHQVKQLTGRYPGLYSGYTLKEALINGGISDPKQTELSQCWLWVAQYSKAAPLIPKLWPSWTLWQYTDGGSGNEPHMVNGVGRCDRDIFNGDEKQLRSFWAANAI